MKWLLAAGLAAILLSIAVFYLAGTGRIGLPGDTSPSAEQSVEHIFAVTIGRRELIVDGRILRRVRRLDDGRVHQIDLSVPWPSTAERLLSHGDPVPEPQAVEDAVFVSIQERRVANPSGERLENVYPRYLMPQEEGEAPVIAGLTQHRFEDGSAYSQQDLFAGETPSGEPVAIRCQRKLDDLIQPMCRRTILLGDKLAAVYRFHRDHLEEWRDVETLVQNLLAEFQPES